MREQLNVLNCCTRLSLISRWKERCLEAHQKASCDRLLIRRAPCRSKCIQLKTCLFQLHGVRMEVCQCNEMSTQIRLRILISRSNDQQQTCKQSPRKLQRLHASTSLLGLKLDNSSKCNRPKEYRSSITAMHPYLSLG